MTDRPCGPARGSRGGARLEAGRDPDRPARRQLRYLEGHGYCERDEAGQVIAVFGTVIDITARVTAENSRAEDEARYRAMSERVLLATQAGQIGVWEWNVQTGELMWDDRMYALYGLVPGEALTAERFVACLHPDDRAEEQALARPPWRAKPYDTEFRVVHPGGEVRSIRALATVVRAPTARRPAGGRQLGRHHGPQSGTLAARQRGPGAQRDRQRPPGDRHRRRDGPDHGLEPSCRTDLRLERR
jgi:PAS domain-containing protein